MADWRVVANRNKTYKKCESEIFANILAVNYGLKLSYLWDVFSISPQDAVKYLLRLNEGKLPTNDLDVVVADGTILLTSIDDTISHLRNVIIENDAVSFVDISNSTPTLVNLNSTTELRKLVCDILSEFEDIASNTINSVASHPQLIQLACTTSRNWTSVFGLLLGYPVIYWFQDSVEKSCCMLSMTPLRVYKIDLLHSFTGQANELKALYSFSVPEQLTDKLESKICCWYSRLNDLCTSSKLSDMKVNLSSTVELLTNVAL